MSKRRPSPALSAFFLREARRWIAFDTVTTRSNRALARRAAFHLRRLRFRSSVHPAGRFANLLARRGSARTSPLFLNTHLDTVPAGPARLWTATGGNPRRATIRGGRLYGLGVADVKLNLLCQIEALRALKDRPFRRPVCVAGTFGEESGLLGAQRLARRWKGPRPALALIGEPSEMRIVCRHNGYLVFEWDVPLARVSPPAGCRVRQIRLRGRSAHSSTPSHGRNALRGALLALVRLEKSGSSPVLLRLNGGTAPNQVPAEATMTVCIDRSRRPVVPPVPWEMVWAFFRRLDVAFRAPFTTNWGFARTAKGRLRLLFDLRFPPRYSPVSLIRRVESMVRSVSRRHGTVTRLRVERCNPGMDTPRRSPEAGIVSRALRRAGFPVRFMDKKTCTEAGVYSQAGFPSLVWGPGRSAGNVHRPNESITLRELGNAIRFYRSLLEDWCF